MSIERPHRGSHSIPNHITSLQVIMTASITRAYSIQQPNREWETEDERLISKDGIHEITLHPVYDYYRLTTVEDPTESIAESRIEYELVLYADQLISANS